MQFYCFHLMPWPYLPEDFADREKGLPVFLYLV